MSYRKGKLSEDRIKRLEDIGVSHRKEWDRYRGTRRTVKSIKKWEQMFDVLRKYKEDHGDCNVPSNWEGNKHLANWVSTQRTNYKNKQLGNDRIRRLEDIGFMWNIYKR
jgi:hypothetical protein